MNISNLTTDIYAMTWRNLLRYIRLPQLLVFSTIQPVMFVILFAYVFGGAIKTPGVNYINYLIPGILVQTVVFGAVQTGIGLSEDLGKGMIERFNSLPISRSAVLAGRTISDTIRNFFVVILMLIVGFIIGYRFEGNVLDLGLVFILLLLFGFAFSWISANIGLRVKEVETAQVAGFIWLFPLVFASSIFVPTSTMPDWLRSLAEANPISIVVNAVRSLSSGGGVIDEVFLSFAWSILLLLIFVPLAVYGYKKLIT